MSKKIISILMGLVLTISLVGCGNSSENTEKKTEVAVENKVTDKELDGKWAKNYNLDQTQKLFNEKLSKMESITKELGIKYKKDEKITGKKDEAINDNSIYFDNENPSANKIESMYFGMKKYGENLESGDISLKLSLKIDGEDVIKNNDFDLGKTSLKKYIEAFTEQENMDFTDINKEIIEKLKKGETVQINNSIDGLKEEIIATKEFIIYKLSTKKYIFADAEMSMK